VAFQAIGRATLSQLCASAEILRDRPGPDGVHQLRVALRRTRVLLKLFKPLSADPAARDLDRDLKWLAGELDTARDLDVLVADIWRPACEQEPGPGAAAFGRALLAAQTGAYLRMEVALESARARALLLETAAWLEAGLWTSNPDLAAVRDGRATIFAARTLDHRRAALVKQGRHLKVLDHEARHRLRLKGKTLRYAAEDLAGLFPDHPRRLQQFVAATRGLQDALGRLNDWRGRAGLAHDVALTHGDAEAAFAAGRLTAGDGDEARMLDEACKARDAFADARAFW
jgi:triphosphatase